MWDLSPLTRDQIGVPCIRWWILNYQTTREAPLIDFRHFKYSFSSLSFDICPTVSSIKRNLIWMLLNAPFFCLISFLWFAWEVFSFVVAGVIAGINHPRGPWGWYTYIPVPRAFRSHSLILLWVQEAWRPFLTMSSVQSGPLHHLVWSRCRGDWLRVTNSASQRASLRLEEREKKMQEEEKGGEGLKLYHMAWNGKVKENALCTCLNVPVWGKKKNPWWLLSVEKRKEQK